MLSLNQGCSICFVLFGFFSLVVTDKQPQQALAYFFATIAYSFLIEMFGYIFFTWLEVVYFSHHPSWSEAKLRKCKLYFLVWVLIVGIALGINSIVENSTEQRSVDNLIAGEVPLVIVFAFHGVALSIGFSICLFTLWRAKLQYSRRLTRLNWAFLGCLLSLVVDIITIFLQSSKQYPNAHTLLLSLFTVFFILPPLIIPPCVMWFFNPNSKIIRDREEDISNTTMGSGQETTEARSASLSRTESGTSGSFTAAKVTPLTVVSVSTAPKSANQGESGAANESDDSNIVFTPSLNETGIVVQAV